MEIYAWFEVDGEFEQHLTSEAIVELVNNGIDNGEVRKEIWRHLKECNLCEHLFEVEINIKAKSRKNLPHSG